MDTAVRDALDANVDAGADGAAIRSDPLVHRLWTWAKRKHLFLLTVALPTLTATVYYGFIASDIYVSQSRFIIHSPQEQRMQTGGLLGEFLQGAGMSRSQTAAYAVKDYIQSRDALKALDQKIDMREAFGSRHIDIFDRFPGLRWNRSFEEFYQYYVGHVGIAYDSGTSISTLTVSAYRPEIAYRINRQLIRISERLVNNLNDRSREDMIRYAEQDVQMAERKATQASLALLAYRSMHAVFAPDKQAAIQLEGIAKLQAQLVTTDAELAQLKQLSPSNPQIPGLRSRAETLRAAISRQASKVTGPTGSLSARAPKFEQLALESTIADKELGAALAELDSARRSAARQQLYLETLVRANLPDSALLPRRVRSIFTVLVVGLILWGALSLVLASIREHTE